MADLAKTLEVFIQHSLSEHSAKAIDLFDCNPEPVWAKLENVHPQIEMENLTSRVKVSFLPKVPCLIDEAVIVFCVLKDSFRPTFESPFVRCYPQRRASS